MPIDQKILNEVIGLQALHAEGLKRATTLRATLEGDVSTSPKALRRKTIIASAVNSRRLKIRAKAAIK